MKIGIFGDSFAHKCRPNISIQIEKYNWFEGELKDRINENIKKDQYFWHDYLQEKGHEVIGYADGGTDIYYSYYQWCHNHHNCDRCIFVVTCPYRYSIRDKKNATGHHERDYWVGVTCYEDAVDKRKNSINLKEKRLFDAFLMYYREILDRDTHKHLTFNKLMLEDVKRQRPDTLFIPAITDEKPCLDDIKKIEMRKPNIVLAKTFDMRDGHLTRQNQYLLGKQVHKAFENGVQELVINFDDYDFNFSDETIKKYWPNKKEAKQLILELYG